MKELQSIPNTDRKKLFKKFFTIVLGGVGSIVIILNSIALIFFMPSNISNTSSSTIINENESTGGGFLNTIFPNNLPVRTSFILYGIDDEHGGADVIILGVFNRLTASIDLINIPRDTFIIISEENQNILRQNNRRFNNPTKITDFFAHGGDIGPLVVRNQLEYWLGIEIHYEVIVDLDAFRSIVDIIGPIQMYIPRRLFYNDGFGLVIDIPAGLQYLDGIAAEGVVRYRNSYALADMQRIQVQQEFMRQLFTQTLQRETLLNLNNLIGLTETLLTYVNTDFPLSSVAMYATYIPTLTSSSLNTYTMPGDPSYFRRNQHGQNISFVMPYEDEFMVMINQIFHGIYLEEEHEVQATAVGGSSSVILES